MEFAVLHRARKGGDQRSGRIANDGKVDIVHLTTHGTQEGNTGVAVDTDVDTGQAAVHPGSQTFEEEAYEGEDSNISRVYRSESGCVMETIVNGYVDEITLLVGVDNSGKVTGVLVEDMNETWGLGRRAMTDQDFLSQLIGTDGEAAVGEDVDALTGATVTSKAVVKAVNSAAAYMTGADVSSSATEWGG